MGMPLRIVQVSGLWQYWQRHMQPVVQPTTRSPGPSTADPVVKECMNPMSPAASAVRTSVSGTSVPRSTRRSNGLLASSGVGCLALSAMALSSQSSSMESAVDHVHLLFACEAHEVHGVARDANRQVGILFRMIHRIHQRLAVEHVHVHVITGHSEVRVENAGQVGDALICAPAEAGRYQRYRERDAVLSVAIGYLGDRGGPSVNAMAVTSVDRVGTGRERFALAASVGRVAGPLAVYHVRGDGEDRLRMPRV